jgi:hypothetical protein
LTFNSFTAVWVEHRIRRPTKPSRICQDIKLNVCSIIRLAWAVSFRPVGTYYERKAVKITQPGYNSRRFWSVHISKSKLCPIISQKVLSKRYITGLSFLSINIKYSTQRLHFVLFDIQYRVLTRLNITKYPVGSRPSLQRCAQHIKLPA